MAIKIRKKIEEEAPRQPLEPEVLPPEGASAAPKEATAPEMSDKFLATSGSIFSWLLEHRRMVIGVSCLIVIAAFSWFGIQRYLDSRVAASNEPLVSALVTYTAYTRAQADEIEAARQQYLESQGIAAETSDILRFSYTVPNDAARYGAIEAHLQKELPSITHEQTRTTGELMLAGTMARLDHKDGAQSAYDKAAASSNWDIKLFAQLGQVELLVSQKKNQEAIALLDTILTAHPGFSSYATLKKGRIYELNGDTDKAIAAYSQVVNEFGQDDDKAIASARLRFLTPDWQKHIKVAPAPQAAL